MGPYHRCIGTTRDGYLFVRSREPKLRCLRLKNGIRWPWAEYPESRRGGRDSHHQSLPIDQLGARQDHCHFLCTCSRAARSTYLLYCPSPPSYEDSRERLSPCRQTLL